jgi:hypothetical protein
MALAEVNGKLYAAAGSALLERSSSATGVRWRVVYRIPHALRPNNSGIRGLTVVPHPTGRGQVLQFATEGVGAELLTYNPATGVTTTDLHLTRFLTRQLGRLGASGYVIAAYNEMPSLRDPVTGEMVQLIGLQVHVPSRPQSAWYLVRRPGNRFAVHEIPALPSREKLGISAPTPVNRGLVAVRAFARSPWDSSIFAGGHDGNWLRPQRNTAWMYHAPAARALGSTARLEGTKQPRALPRRAIR